MSDVTRQPGGSPAERDRQTPGTHGETALGTDRTDEAYPAPGARAETTPGLDTTTPARHESTTSPARHESTTSPAAHGSTLLPHEECDKLGQRLQHAVADFVDAPRASVEEADRVLEEITARFTDAVTHRRRTLRTSWQDTGGDDRATSTDTEQLRLALRDYRELADRLMRL
ncbi:hypothetical protein RI578_27710 [Streptomyces sp. BB1-1-1]|uniref:hypothetical protein n=1 Tax=Streptomyces sp. BB1-1-1 TaxID=3074430 RepID=UPI002877B74E|nr:hypothetical protein [Streptomyces sp. BB1-1-1]WND37839.1 hypothetical protein RI578_27710 [Streptomyces sp. BB1-1-1]